jgi:CDP-6-deoxy-D-xylo-4-hexulose-3-dehydrase
MAPYVDFCRKHGLVMMEDCCESLGAFDEGRHVGTFGHGGTLSHFYSHHLTTLEGGAILTDDDALADDLRSMRAHGWIRDRSDRDRLAEESPRLDPRFLFVMPGYNVRPTELHAAIGLVQLRRMDDSLRARETLAAQVHAWVTRHAPWLRLVGAEALSPIPTARSGRRHSWMTLPFVLRQEAPHALAEVKAKLEANGVETRPIIAGNLTRHPAARHGGLRAAPRLPVADLLLDRGFMIGCPPRPAAASLATLHAAIAALGS